MRDRYGETVDVEDQADLADVVQLPHECDNGWIDREADNPVPCLHCRPHLARNRQPLPDPDPDQIRAGIQRCRSALTVHTSQTTETLVVSHETEPRGAS